MNGILRAVSLGVALALVAAAAAAQDRESPPELSEAEEIALARSAAPATVSRDATVLVLRDGRYRTAHEGSTGVTCMVSRSLPLSLEPICYDAEASRTILAIELARVEMRLDGVTLDEVERRLDRRIASGELSVPERPAMAYMMSSAQVLYADAETRVGAWMPHVHLYMPNATAEQFGVGSEPMSPEVWNVADEGEPTANLVVRVREFVDPEPAARPGPRL